MYEAQELKTKLAAGEICLGSWISFADPTVVELMAGSGFDFFIIDSEHAPADVMVIQSSVMATKGTRVTPIVRVAWNDPVLIKRVLDVGAAGVLVPMIRTDQEAINAVAACMYPPKGIRGFGPRRPSNYERFAAEYIATANDSIIVWAQIEHIEAIRNIDEIVAVEGLGGVFIGANDLSGSMGILGQPGHPDVLQAIDKVLTAAKKAGLPVGIGGPGKPEVAVGWIRKGMQFVTLASDQSYLVAATEAAVSGVKQMLAEKV
ncbi:MAG: hypothetical protein HYX78_08065 [Armatimonadetes bacterium]|nr:hypothetical protein [Armatimonadota bacterium]